MLLTYETIAPEYRSILSEYTENLPIKPTPENLILAVEESIENLIDLFTDETDINWKNTWETFINQSLEFLAFLNFIC